MADAVLLRHLDQHDYGLWLLTAQVLFYLALTDLGVVALVPREVAFTTGRAAEKAAEELRQLVGETTRLVIWQMPFAAIGGAARGGSCRPNGRCSAGRWPSSCWRS